jgi:spore germination cell wall hydrolase CwlJ-like protein
MTDSEQRLLAECSWKENRRGQSEGMTSIINVVQNRVGHRNYPSTIEGVIMQPKQFTSMSVKSDPEYSLDPAKSKGVDLAAWQTAQGLAQGAADGKLEDLTHGSTLYYAPKSIMTHATIALPTGETIPFPQKWNPAKVVYKATIQGQLFFTEI